MNYESTPPPPWFALEDENSRLRKIVADLTLDREMLPDVVGRKL
jgi:putative transposase